MVVVNGEQSVTTLELSELCQNDQWDQTDSSRRSVERAIPGSIVVVDYFADDFTRCRSSSAKRSLIRFNAYSDRRRLLQGYGRGAKKPAVTPGSDNGFSVRSNSSET